MMSKNKREDETHKEKIEQTDADSLDKPKEVSSEKDSETSQTVQMIKAEYETLVKESKELAQVRDRYLRSAADFENAKKRLVREREAFFKYALEDVVFGLLPVMDNLERAIAHIEGSDEKMKPIRDGFVLIQKQLAQTLAERGLKRIEVIGKPFDPHIHDAVEHITETQEPEGTILEEVLVGYELNGKLIRPAKVKVAATKESSS